MGYRSYKRKSVGRERALEHIRQADILSDELGGADQDVKQYFFSLSQNQLNGIFDEYERKYGSSARGYAEITFPKWKYGEVHMSGMVAERLFNLLPPVMPLEVKYQLTESLWEHVGPSSEKAYYVGNNVNIEEISRLIKNHLEEVVLNYKIPSVMEARFDWLSHGDVGIKQQLLNYFRQRKKQLLIDVLELQLPVLLNQLNGGNENFTTHITQVLRVGKHEVRIIVSEGFDGVYEKNPAEISKSSDSNWILWVVGIVILCIVLSSCAFAATITGQVVKIADGDTLTIIVDQQQIKVRLSDIDAPERKQPFGEKSKQSLADLCFQKIAQVSSHGKDRYGRVIGRVWCDGKDAINYQIRAGMAWVYDRYATDVVLYWLQNDARLHERGLWQDARPVPPWEWRERRKGRVPDISPGTRNDSP